MDLSGLVSSIAVFVSAAQLAIGVALAATAPDGVLIIHSNQRPTPAAVIVEDGIRNTVNRGVGRPIEVFSEYLDIERFSDASYVVEATEFLAAKYGDRHIRVIVASAPSALQFATRLRSQISTSVPVVHVAVPQDALEQLPPSSGVVGAMVDLDPLSTLQLAMHLRPGTTRIVFVTGASQRDRVWEQRLRSAAVRMDSRLEFEYLTALPTAEVLRRVANLPPGTIVYTPGYFVDGSGRVVTPRQSLELIAPASTAPVFVPFDTFLGTGVVGGYMAPYEEQSRMAGSIVVHLLNGGAASDMPAAFVQNVPMVDARQIRRWGIDEGLLPPDTVVRFREPSAWDKYGREISVGIALFLMQAGLILLLLVERRGRQRTSRALEESQKQMQLAAHAARLSLWTWDASRDQLERADQIQPRSSAEGRQRLDFKRALQAAHPADRDELERAMRHAVASGGELDVEYRQTAADGSVRWLAARGRVDAEGSQRLLGVVMDVTDRKHSEMQAADDRAALQHMTRVSMLGQLSAAIAHQVNQPLAAILGNAEAAQKMLSRDNVDLAELRDICRDIVSENHRASEVIGRLRELFRRGDLKTAPLNLNELVRETVELVRAELLVHHVVAITHLAPSLPMIQAGHVQLQQVLLNLILNAIDAMDSTLVELRRLHIRTELNENQIRLSVTDQGTGIPHDSLKTVFQAFWTTKNGGMGIGLAISHAIITAHRGSIVASNNASGGATFCVSLPAGATA